MGEKYLQVLFNITTVWREEFPHLNLIFLFPGGKIFHMQQKMCCSKI